MELEAPDAANPGSTKRVDEMAALQADVFAGRINPGEVKIVREIEPAAGGHGRRHGRVLGHPRPTTTSSPSRTRREMTVVHARGTQVDGTDTLRNVERLKFADQNVEIADDPDEHRRRPAR